MLLVVAFYTLAERKAMGAIQRRRGPTITGFWGLLQPISDGLKLVIKEVAVPKKVEFVIYLAAPLITFGLSLLNWVVIPFNFGNVIADINYGILYLLTVSGLGIYGVVLSGWASNSKYSLLGGLRAAAQMVSYEIPISLSLLPVIIVTGTLNLSDIVFFQMQYIYLIFILFPSTIIFFIAILAETNRAPFDLSESEAEIVAGYNLEYSGILFAMFFLGEYNNMIAMSSLINILFLGGWAFFSITYPYFGLLIFSVKTILVAFLFILVRAILPRYRFDQLMQIGWKSMIPLSLGFLIFTVSILFGLNLLNVNSHIFI
jgi:NADH-quinone oxidoreductase subunit H